jgi:hypothetical protein
VKQERFGNWADWYNFARATLGYSRNEAGSYANLRYVEELNRLRLRDQLDEDTRRLELEATALAPAAPCGPGRGENASAWKATPSAGSQYSICARAPAGGPAGDTLARGRMP